MESHVVIFDSMMKNRRKLRHRSDGYKKKIVVSLVMQKTTLQHHTISMMMLLGIFIISSMHGERRLALHYILYSKEKPFADLTIM